MSQKKYMNKKTQILKEINIYIYCLQFHHLFLMSVTTQVPLNDSSRRNSVLHTLNTSPSTRKLSGYWNLSLLEQHISSHLERIKLPYEVKLATQNCIYVPSRQLEIYFDPDTNFEQFKKYENTKHNILRIGYWQIHSLSEIIDNCLYCIDGEGVFIQDLEMYLIEERKHRSILRSPSTTQKIYSQKKHNCLIL